MKINPNIIIWLVIGILIIGSCITQSKKVEYTMLGVSAALAIVLIVRGNKQ